MFYLNLGIILGVIVSGKNWN